MVVNGIAAAYSVVQVLRCGVSMVRGSVLLNKPLAWLILLGDQVYMVQFQISFHACVHLMSCVI